MASRKNVFMTIRFCVSTVFHKTVNMKSYLCSGLIIGACLAAPTASQATLSFVGRGYVILDANGGGNSYYNVDNSSDHSTASYSSTLGGLTIQQGQSLYIGGNVQTYQPGTGTTTWIGYKLYKGATLISENDNISLSYNGAAPYPNGNNDDWEKLASASGVNVDNSLSSGTYTLQVWFGANNGGTTIYDSNNNNNYSATFDVTAVPEPVTLALPIFGGLMVTAGLARRFVFRTAEQAV